MALTHYKQVPDSDVTSLKARLETIRILLKQKKLAAALAVIKEAEPLQHRQILS